MTLDVDSYEIVNAKDEPEYFTHDSVEFPQKVQPFNI